MLLLLAAGAQSSVAEEGKKEFTATLANGVTVELIGVSYHSTGAKLSEPKRWWRPDGSDLDAEPYRHPRRCTTGIPGYYTREFAFRITGADEYSCATFNSSGRTNVQPVIPLNENNESIPDLLAFADRFKNSQSEDTIRIGVSIEPWEKVEEWEEAWNEFGITAPDYVS